MSGPLPQAHIVITDTYGASLLGAFATAVLYGLTTLQTYFYFVFYPKDSKSNKALIWVIWLLDTVQMILVIMCMYHYLITNYANPAVLPVGHWTLFPPKIFAATPFAIFAVLSDILIAAALCVLLHGSKTGMKRTNAIITTLIIFAINRCLLTSVVAIIEVIVFAVKPHSLWFIGFDFVIGKLYANSLLATLNSRAVIRDKNSTSGGVNSVHVSDNTNLSFRVQSSTRGTDSRSNAFSELPRYGQSYDDGVIPLDLRSASKSKSDHTITVSTNEIVRYDYALDAPKSRLEDA
ncbi:hypothetical protein CVT24_013078 [Panaeolus cyanescens]|uniref:DUF6534 domain-containing protein n=1 Tax=Panaeolus cyanescens TaxID=181874 RepID=A0A409VVJ0_9AGAR|nr:hypothetical protein CVT24_013078 [Panaeolus cyanescens]